MKKSIALLFIFTTLFVCIRVFGQSKTPFQKKSRELSAQLLRDLGVNAATLREYNSAGDIGALFLIGDMSEKLQTKRGMLAYFKYQQGLKDAEKLKNAVDHKREANQNAVTKKRKEAELSKEKTRREQSEQAFKEEQRSTIYNNSDFVVIGNEIKQQFEQWANKGEFEKTLEYDNRIASGSSNQFTEVCFNVIHRKTSSYLPEDNISNSKHEFLNLKLGSYNADEERYSVSVIIPYTGDEITGIVNISLPEAEEFKLNFSNYKKQIDVKCIYR